MTVGGISGHTFYEKLHQKKGKSTQNETQAGTAFSDNLKENNLTAAEEEVSGVEESVAINAASNNLHTSVILQESGRIQLHAAIECSARHITYAQSDHIKVCVSAGYTLKAQVEAERHKVYIEKKTDDGEITAYEVDPLKLNKDTTDPLEQMALESWELARRAWMGEEPVFKKAHLSTGIEESEDKDDYSDLTISEAMERFYTFVEDRIKNGDPKYQIGGSEMSVKEWNRLIAKIDEEINAAKEQLREELQKAKEKAGVPQDKEPQEDEILGITKEQIARLFEDPDQKNQEG